MDSVDPGDYAITDDPKVVPVSRNDPYVPPLAASVDLSASIAYPIAYLVTE
jgi:hypothetical protein